MRFNKDLLCLYAVTDRAWVGEKTLYEQVEEALKNGVTCVQLREKHLDVESFLKEARELSGLCRKYKVPLIVNDNVDVAIESGADGVHVGQDDMTSVADIRKKAGDNMIVGVSVHNQREAVTAQREGADYIGIGAVFSTSTKKDVDVLSYSEVKSICGCVTIPAVAIGGINAGNIRNLAGCGVCGVAVVSSIFGAGDIGASTKKLLSESVEYLKEK